MNDDKTFQNQYYQNGQGNYGQQPGPGDMTYQNIQNYQTSVPTYIQDIATKIDDLRFQLNKHHVEILELLNQLVEKKS